MRSNRWCLVFLSLLGLVALTAGTASAQSQSLRWNLQKGQALKLNMKHEMDQKM
jgi:hypothetical protein